jgi:hypothetical protein
LSRLCKGLVAVPCACAVEDACACASRVCASHPRRPFQAAAVASTCFPAIGGGVVAGRDAGTAAAAAAPAPPTSPSAFANSVEARGLLSDGEAGDAGLDTDMDGGSSAAPATEGDGGLVGTGAGGAAGAGAAGAGGASSDSAFGCRYFRAVVVLGTGAVPARGAHACPCGCGCECACLGAPNLRILGVWSGCPATCDGPHDGASTTLHGECTRGCVRKWALFPGAAPFTGVSCALPCRGVASAGGGCTGLPSAAPPLPPVCCA